MMQNNELIDEINVLLEDHSEALTEFYDEGIEVGTREGFVKCGLCTLGITAAIVCGKVIYSAWKKAK